MKPNPMSDKRCKSGWSSGPAGTSAESTEGAGGPGGAIGWLSELESKDPEPKLRIWKHTDVHGSRSAKHWFGWLATSKHEPPAQCAVVRAPAAAARVMDEGASRMKDEGDGRRRMDEFRVDAGACTARGETGVLARPHSCSLCPSAGAPADGRSVWLRVTIGK